ncbi:PSB5A [Hepatospora eriocheir]|uniref:Proteasome subunit beta n=1 Tax=Hepatospora eriocheir TaxID=1081669 RepID=A0A1X0QB51_9MICR|nr:PSB5A [Hepatospora eriocheir]
MFSIKERDQTEIDNIAIDKEYVKNNIKYSKGTTTLAFTFQGGMIIAVDSRATSGSYIASQTVNKVIEVNNHLLGTMAGGAADCAYWEGQMGLYAKRYELETGKRITVSNASKYLVDCLRRYKGYGLSVGSMVCGYDGEIPKIFFVDDSGSRIENNLFSVGSGSPIAIGVLNSKYRHELTKEEAIELGKEAIYRAGHRDAMSGGTVNVIFMNENGWTRVGRWDFNELREHFD